MWVCVRVCKYVSIPEAINSARNKLVSRFLKIEYFIGYYTAVPLKMYGKYGRSK